MPRIGAHSRGNQFDGPGSKKVWIDLPQGVLRLNGRERLFGEAKRLVVNKFTPLANLCNRQASPFGVM